ncbi:uncharacterized protein LOC114935397 isoform X1 [Nylanderia fulva]|uniref:uncharacterized protein LOC114935397 isoform X1 n=1 Tax=Nylanderia fulva TaxID=613905 RepID=UPI0010FB395F|nr:uncharacterized protein LOC114935397 isoform X1 [Nylanderia fulva]
MFQFALTSLHKYATIKSKEDFVFSPYSIYQELFSVYLISSADIEQRLKNILYLPNVSKYELMRNIKFDKYSSIHHKYPTKRPARDENAASNQSQLYAVDNKCIFLNTILRKNIEIKKLYNCGFTSNESNDIQDINRKINQILKILTKDYNYKPLELEIKREGVDIILMNVHNFHGRYRSISQLTSIEMSLDSDRLLSNTSSNLSIKTFSSDELQVHVKELIIKKDFTSLFMLIPFSSSTDKRVKTDTSSTSLPSLIERLSTSEGMRKLRKLLFCVETGGSLSFVTWPTFEIEKRLDMQVLLRELGVEQLIDARRNSFGQHLRGRRSIRALRQCRAPCSCQGHGRECYCDCGNLDQWPRTLFELYYKLHVSELSVRLANLRQMECRYSLYRHI